MTMARQLKLSETPIGRIELHFLTFLRDKNLPRHIEGIMREFKNKRVR